jgi:hypothetical protein
MWKRHVKDWHTVLLKQMFEWMLSGRKKTKNKMAEEHARCMAEKGIAGKNS